MDELKDTTPERAGVPIGTIRTSAEIDKLIPALLKAQRIMGHAHKDGENPHFRSKYTTLTSVLDAARDPLNANDILLMQGTEVDGSSVRVTSAVIHSTGQWAETTVRMEAKDDTPQSIGSTITYGRRYTATSLMALGQDDDDGNAGTRGSTPSAPRLSHEDATKAFFEQWDKTVKGIKGADDKAFNDAMQHATIANIIKSSRPSGEPPIETTDIKDMTPGQLQFVTGVVKAKAAGLKKWLKSMDWDTENEWSEAPPNGGGPVCGECGKELTSEEADENMAAARVVPICKECQE